MAEVSCCFEIFNVPLLTIFNRDRRLPSHLASNIFISPKLFASSRDGRFIFSAGHWDSSFQVFSVEGGQYPPKCVDLIFAHLDIVTCIAIGEDGKTLVTGSRDTTVIAWDLVQNSGDIVVRQETRKMFYGHDEEVF